MENTLTTKQRAFDTHARIMANGQVLQNTLLEICKDLKAMRDERLYIELGYETFEDYAEQAVGLKQRQAYSYISTYEKLGAKYIEENSGLGITKLELISQISSYEREEFLEDADVESATVRDLKEKVEEFKKQTEQLTFELDNKKEENADLIQQIKDMQDSMEDTPLEEPDAEIVKRAVDEAVKKANEANAEVINKLKQQVKDEKAKAKSAKEDKEEAIKEAKEKAIDEANKKIDELVKEKNASDEKLKEALKAAKVANADEDVMAIRFLFSELQSTANKITSHLDNVRKKDEQQANKLSQAITNILNNLITDVTEK